MAVPYPSRRASAPNPDAASPACAPPFITASGRDLRIDMLRGLCVLIVVVNHVAGPSPLYLLTGGDRFLTSAAEAFILISGLTAGLVYRRLVARDGVAAAMLKALRRAGSLFLLTVGLTFLLAPVSEYFRLPWSASLDLSRSARFVVSVLTLHRTYAFVDILLLYTLLFLALPAALLLVERGHARVALLISWAIWLLYQLYPEPATFPWPIAGGHLFAFSAWQALFFTAFVLSFRRERLPALGPAARNRLLWLTAVAFAGLVVVFALVRLPAAGLPARAAGLQGWALDHVFAKASMGPGRIVATVVVFGFLLLSAERWWTLFSRPLRGLLLPFGQHALYAWTAQILVVVAVGLLVQWLGLAEDNPWLNLALQLSAVAAVWLLTRRQFLAVTPTNRRYWYVVPAALALFALLMLQLPAFDGPAARPGPAAAEVAPAKTPLD